MRNEDRRSFIIAEAGVNHNGSLEMALELINCAASAGADAVKFQTFVSKDCVSGTAPKAKYQKETTAFSESQLEMLCKLELCEEHHRILYGHCQKQGIEYMSTAFDLTSLKSLLGLRPSRLKISSGEIESAPLLVAAARSGLPLLLSTGTCGLADIEIALGVLAFGYLDNGTKPSRSDFSAAYFSPAGQAILKEKVTLLHCTTEYPTPMSDVNLRAIHTLKTAFGLPVGYSDHTEGIAVSGAAVALGATVVEKHFTLDRKLPGPDHKASIEPNDLRLMVRTIRDIEHALGNGVKVPALSEAKNRDIVRKSLVAKCNILEGELYTESNLTWKRPGGGVSPLDYWDYLGCPARKGFCYDQQVE